MVCPILKTREMLYKGGAISEEETTDRIVTVDGVDMVFDDAPMIIGLSAFGAVRRGGAEDRDLRIIDTLHRFEVREAIRGVYEGGAATVPTREDIKGRYGKENLMLVEKKMRDDLILLASRR